MADPIEQFDDDNSSDYIPVNQAIKLISHNFDGNVKDLRSFCEGVEAAVALVHQSKQNILLKFIESKIIGDAKQKLLARSERGTWVLIKGILEENYSVRRTLEYYAGTLFAARQGQNETVAQWGSRVDTIGLDLHREVRNRMIRLEDQQAEQVNFTTGAGALVSELLKGTFIAGLKDERVKYIVKTKGEEVHMAQLIETALQEESECKSQRFKNPSNEGTFWHNRQGNGYKHDNRGKPVIKREVNMVKQVDKQGVCYRCQGKGHFARDCRNKAVCRNCNKIGHETRECRMKQHPHQSGNSNTQQGSNQGNRQ